MRFLRALLALFAVAIQVVVPIAIGPVVVSALFSTQPHALANTASLRAPPSTR